MIKSVEINWEAFGAEFATESDENQAKFFKGFACEISHWVSDHHKQMQGSMVADKLTESHKKELETFMQMLWFKDQ